MVPGFRSMPVGRVTLITALANFESGALLVEVAVTVKMSPTRMRSSSCSSKLSLCSTFTVVSISAAAGSLGSTGVGPTVPGSAGCGLSGSAGSGLASSPTTTMFSGGKGVAGSAVSPGSRPSSGLP